MVSLKDIAKATGISLTQVSRALNNHSDVSEATKEKVRQAAKQMGYVKNINAQRLATKRSNQIALMLHGLYFSDTEHYEGLVLDIIKGVNEFAQAKGYEPVVHLVDGDTMSYKDFCKQRGIEGVILFGTDYDAPNFKELIESDFPCVVIDIPVEGKNKGCIIINDAYYAMMAVKHLIEEGKKHIVMINGNEHSMVSKEREVGYQMALVSAKIPIDDTLIRYCNFQFDEAYKEVKRLIETRPEVDSFFFASDVMALGGLKALKECNKAVPEEISIFGFDGISIVNYTTPTISTVKQDNYKKGYNAAKLLCQILNEEECERTVMLSCQLIYNESS